MRPIDVYKRQASAYDVTRLAQEYNLPLELPEQEPLKRGDVEGKRRQTEALFRAQATVFPELVDKLAEQIARNHQTELLETIELPLARVLAQMCIRDSHNTQQRQKGCFFETMGTFSVADDLPVVFLGVFVI